MSEKIKGMYGNPKRAEDVRAWLRSQGVETVFFNCNKSDYIYYAVDGNAEFAEIECEKLFDIVHLPPRPLNFKPFEKVLVRDSDEEYWSIELFDSLIDDEEPFKCMCGKWAQCVPYEGNESLLGTNKNPD